MPCVDYCDIFLTHDAPRVRKDHNSGWKHAMQVRAHYQGVNQDKMQRTLAEVIKDYQARAELVPVPAPMMMRPPPGIRPPHPSGPGMMGTGMRPPMQMMGPAPGMTFVHGMGMAPSMHPPGGMTAPAMAPQGGGYPPPPIQPMLTGMAPHMHGSVPGVPAIVPTSYPFPQMDPNIRPPHLQSHQPPAMPPTAPWHAPSTATTLSPPGLQQSHQRQQDHHHQRN